MSPIRIASVLLCGAVMAGCGDPRDAPGGTMGSLHAAGQPLPDVLVSAHRDSDAGEPPLGSALTQSDGSFTLRTAEPIGPLWLEPGTYCFTLESAGEVPLVWPAEFADAQKTPLKRTIVNRGEAVALQAPLPTVVR
jgi:hypothetical protein